MKAQVVKIMHKKLLNITLFEQANCSIDDDEDDDYDDDDD